MRGGAGLHMTATSASGKRPDPEGFFSTLNSILDLPKHAADDDNVRTVLKAELDRLPTAWRDRIGALLNLGRKVHERDGSVPEGRGAAPLDASALCDKQTRADQYLERGLAMMYSEGVDPEGSETRAQGGARRTSVFQRAWSHFGRELASSEPDEWSWFAHRADGTDEFERIFLRRGDRAWWAFGASLDRPKESHVSGHAKAAKKRRGDSGSGLQSLATHQYCRRRALRRAMRSVNARLGILAGVALRPAMGADS
jgi:hypothetical protein